MILRLLTAMTPKQEGNFVRAPRSFSSDVHTQLKKLDRTFSAVVWLSRWLVLGEPTRCFQNGSDWISLAIALWDCRLTTE